MKASRLLAACALAAVPLTTAAGGADTPAALTLSQALQRVAKSSQASADRDLDVAASRQLTRQTRASLYPTLDISGGFTDRDSPAIAVFGDFEAPLNDNTYLQYQVSARYLLWDGGLRRSSIAAAQALEDVAGDAGDVRIVGAQLEGMGAYLQAMMAKARQAAVAKRIDAVQGHLKVVQDMFGQGMVARNDLLETEVRLRTVKDRALELTDQEDAAVRELERLMGEAPGGTMSLPDRLPPPPPLGGSRDELVKDALDSNPLIRAAQAKVTAAAKQAALQQLTGRPKVFAEAAHTYEQNPYMLYPNANYIFLGFSWNLFDGGTRTTQRERASLEVAKAQRALEEARRQASNGVDKAYREYRQALREAKTARANVAAAEENLRIEEDQYRAGLAKTTDVLDAEALLAESRFTLIAQHYNAYLKQGRLLAFSGKNLVEFYSSLAPSTEAKGASS
ncbi:MAG: TolC family protein [Acidobacteria bacterium]|nr:TolC family protein [Acidobacteriota bacterium]